MCVLPTNVHRQELIFGSLSPFHFSFFVIERNRDTIILRLCIILKDKSSVKNVSDYLLLHLNTFFISFPQVLDLKFSCWSL